MSLPIPKLPSGLGAFALSSSSHSLTLPNTVTSGSEERSGTAYHAEVEGKSGTVRNRASSLEAIEIDLSGVLFGPTEVSTVKKIVGDGRVTLTRDERTLVGDVTAYQVRERITGKVWDFQLTLLSNEHYWAGEDVTSVPNPTLVNNSGDLSVHPVFTITGGVGGATEASVSIGSRAATYTGAIASGETLVVDCETLEAKLAGAGVLGGMNAGFFTRPPELVPGSNGITFTVTGAADLVVSYTERHL